MTLETCAFCEEPGPGKTGAAPYKFVQLCTSLYKIKKSSGRPRARQKGGFDTLRTRFDTLRHNKKNFPGVQSFRKCRLSPPAAERSSTFCPRYPRLSTIKKSARHAPVHLCSPLLTFKKLSAGPRSQTHLTQPFSLIPCALRFFGGCGRNSVFFGLIYYG